MILIAIYIVKAQKGYCDNNDPLACNSHGTCVDNLCYCDDEYATEDEDDPCDYKRKSQLVAFLLDFFINGGGQIYLGYLNWGIPRLILLFWPIITIIIILPAIIIALLHKLGFLICCGCGSTCCSAALDEDVAPLALCALPFWGCGCCLFIHAFPWWIIIICTLITWIINGIILFVWWLVWIILIGTNSINDANGIAMNSW